MGTTFLGIISWQNVCWRTEEKMQRRAQMEDRRNCKENGSYRCRRKKNIFFYFWCWLVYFSTSLDLWIGTIDSFRFFFFISIYFCFSSVPLLRSFLLFYYLKIDLSLDDCFYGMFQMSEMCVLSLHLWLLFEFFSIHQGSTGSIVCYY